VRLLPGSRRSRGPEAEPSSRAGRGRASRDPLLVCDRVLLTSATLAVDEDFDPLLEALGLTGSGIRTASLPSPFPLERQVLSVVWDGSGPNDPRYAERLAGLIVSLATRLHRNMLVLLTSYQMLDQVELHCAGPLAHEGIPLLRQSPGEAAAPLAAEFRAAQGTVLLGAASFWEGWISRERRSRCS